MCVYMAYLKYFIIYIYIYIYIYILKHISRYFIISVSNMSYIESSQ